VTPIARLRLLGEFRLETIAGSTVALRARKAKALLAFLALTPRGESRQRLATLLWGDMGDDRARANLRQALSHLREALNDPGSALVSDDERIVLAEGALAVDVHEFVRLAQSQDSADWQRALRLHGSELLTDLELQEEPFAEWKTEQRRALLDAVCGVCAKLARVRRERGDTAGAEEALERWLAIDDACEDAHRTLAELYAESGRRAQALAQLERCKTALARAYGACPDERTNALARSLAVPQPPALRAAKPSIAVLPFDDLSGEREVWLSDGIAEDVIIGLSKFDRLLVIARQSSFVFRGQTLDVREIGRALGARYVLSGTVRRARERLCITVQLADADSGATVWGERYERVAGDLFTLETEITRIIVATLAGRVESGELARIAKKPTDSLEAYDWLLKAKLHHHRYTPADNALAQECLERARALDPDFALAYAWAACVLVQGNSFNPDPSRYARAREYVTRALALEEGETECHRILASANLAARCFEEAEEHQRRALELNPNDDRVLSQMGEFLTYIGRPAEALPWIELAMRLNPYLADTTCCDHARALYHLGRMEEARASLRRVRVPRAVHHVYQAAIAGHLQQFEERALHLDQARRLNPAFRVEPFVRALPYKDAAVTAAILADLGHVT
jgi:TolB-like protein/tetratricopeptide (TPR) repeat protein